MTRDVSRKVKTTQAHVGCLVLYTALGERAKPIQREIEGFLHHNGVEWTCERMKSIWTASNHLKNGDRAKALSVYQRASIAFHRDTMYPKGAFGPLVKGYVEARRPSVIRRYAACLKCYTSLTLGSRTLPSRKQSTKAVKSISMFSSSRIRPEDSGMFLAAFRRRYANLSAEDRRKIAKGLTRGELHANSYYFTTCQLNRAGRQAIADLPYGSMLLSLMTESWIPDSLNGVIGSDLARQTQLYEYGIDSGFAGRILGMQQNGCKLRCVAQPTAALQRAFLPLHGSLRYATDVMYHPEDCVEDQIQGVFSVKEHLKSGFSVYSVDLSSATDRFPRSVTQAMLDVMGLERYSRALEEVCNRPWKNENLLGPKQLYYEVGQPMGLYGSFPMFHLSNLAIADAALDYARHVPNITLTAFADGTFFKVLGDDIVLSDPVVAMSYQHMLGMLGVEISPTKTFSGQVAEFAGFMVVPSKDGYTAFRPYKATTEDRGYISNPMDFVHSLGANVSTLGDRWAKIFLAYQSTCGQRTLDLSPAFKVDRDPQPHIVGQEAWLHSCLQKIEVLISESENAGSRTNLCVQDWLSERSGYNFASQSFPDYVNSVVRSSHHVERLDDFQFSPESALPLLKKLKKEESYANEAIQNFWKDPLNAKWKYEIENSISTSSAHLSFEEAIELAKARSAFSQLKQGAGHHLVNREVSRSGDAK